MKATRFVIEETAGVYGVLTKVGEILYEAVQGGTIEIIIRRPTRTFLQNRKLWPMLSEVSKQVEWYGYTLTSEEWKIVLTASLKRQKIVPAIDGGFVALGLSTRGLSKKDFSDLIELIYAFGAEQGVVWGGKALSTYSKYREAA
jgi:hypothetical protein